MYTLDIEGSEIISKPYIYNLGTHTLHIENYCHHTHEGMYYGTRFKCFASEDEAVAYDRRSVSMCKLCFQKRDAIIKEMRKQK